MLLLLACGPGVDPAPDTDDSHADAGWVDADGDGYSPDSSELADCDDNDPEDHPRAVEICDGEDDDCNGVIDDEVTSPYYADGDLDGYGNPAVHALGCAPFDEYVGNDDDCDDDDASVHPDAPEQCNDQDDDCDGRIDEDPIDPATWYADADDDGHGDASMSEEACSASRGTVPNSDDCDDANADVYPGAAEFCDGLDDDCDGTVPDDEVDADADGQLLCAGDCDDTDATVWIGGVELCDDGLDNDCDGTADSDCLGCDYVVLTAASSIQDAIDAASDGDVICAGGDTFYETLDFSGKDVALVGVGPDLSVLDGGGVDRVVNFTSGESASAVLQDFYGAALHLDAASPLVDAGDPAILDPDGSTADIGWFGGPGADLFDLDGDGWASWWLPGPYDATSSPALDCDDEDDAIYPGSGC